MSKDEEFSEYLLQNGITDEQHEAISEAIYDGHILFFISPLDPPQIKLQVRIKSEFITLGAISLQTLILNRIHSASRSASNEQIEPIRSQLFSLAGRLRELAQIAEDVSRKMRQNEIDGAPRQSI